MVTSSLRICAGSVNKLVINQLYYSVAEVLLYKNRQSLNCSWPAQIQKSQLIGIMIMISCSLRIVLGL